MLRLIANLSVGRKLLVINILSATTVLLTSASLLLWKNYLSLEEQLNLRMDSAVEIVATNINAAVLFEDWQTAEELASSLLQDRAIKGVRVYDGDSVQRAQTPAAIRDDKLAKRRTEVIDRNDILGRVEILYSEQEVQMAMRRAIFETCALVLAALLLGLVVSNKIQRIVTHPLEDMAQFVHRVSETKDYHLRVQRAYADEVGELADSLNVMLALIEERDQYLEQQVRERTADLHQRSIEKERAIAAQEESQKRFEQAFTNAPIGMALLHQDCGIQLRNDTLNNMLQIQSDQKLVLTDIVDEEDFAASRQTLVRHQNGLEPTFSINTRTTLNTGKTLELAISLGEVTDGWGSYLYSVMQIQDTTESVQLSKKLMYQASHDEMTGLANRRSLEHVINRASEARDLEGPLYSICMIDLDRFKLVNDTSGHAAGDALLVEIARVLKSEVRPDDTVVGMGGDEFALFLRRCPTNQAVSICERISERIETMVFRWEGASHTIGASIGIMTVEADSALTSEQILKRADTACYTAKVNGRGKVVVFDEQSDEIRHELGEFNWVRRINEALEEDHFTLFVQEVMPLQEAAKASQHVEVLLRLKDRENKRYIPPGEFLPAADRHGLQIQVDQWVVKNTLRASKVYNDFFQDNRGYWINLSGTSLCDPKFVDFVANSISYANLPSGAVNFEITETAVISNLKRANYAIDRFRELGCQFALDDFGTGVSSFGYLKSLPVDFVKIDGVFVRNVLEDDVNLMFVRSIIEIAHAMGKKTIVEYVENEQVLEVMRSIGADYAQGYVIDKPRELKPLNFFNETPRQALWG